MKNLRFTMNHVQRKANEIIFTKCDQDVITTATIMWLVKTLGNIYENVNSNGPILSHLPIIQITIWPISR